MIVLGHDREVAAWVGERLDSDLFRIFAAIGLERSGQLVGGGVLHNWSEYDMELSYFGRLTAGMVRELQAAAVRSGVLRVTLRTPRCNPIRRSVTKLGFVYEGIQRRLYGPTKAGDAIMYGRMIS